MKCIYFGQLWNCMMGQKSMILHLNLVMNSCLPSLFHVPHEFLPQFYFSRRKKILDSNNRVLEMERWLGSKIAQCSCRGVVFSSPHYVRQLITTWKMKIWDSDVPLSTLHSTHLYAHIHTYAYTQWKIISNRTKILMSTEIME